MKLTGAKGFVIGVGALAAADLFLGSSKGTQAYSTIVGLPTQWLANWFDPTVPLIADHRSSTSSSGSGGGSGSDPCAGTYGLAKQFCQAGQSASLTTPPPTDQIPTQSTVQALQV